MLLRLLFILLTLFPGYTRAADSCMLVIRNSQSFYRHKEIISIGKQQFGIRSTAVYPVVYRQQQQYICQPVDTDKDGRWDSLFLELSLPPFTTDTVFLCWQEQEPVSFPASTNVRFSLRSTDGLPCAEISDTFRLRGYTQDISKPAYQLEGPGIENDKVAFRVFFDSRNGKDIYGKRTTTPVLDRVGLTGSWHTLQDWGMDILRTGQSLGAGAFAIREAGKDYKLADADSTVFTHLYEGALAAAFRLDFYGWDAGTRKQRGSEVITIQKGDYFYTTTLQVPMQPHQELIQGFAHFYQDSLYLPQAGTQCKIIATYGQQAEGDTSPLGLALLVPQNRFAGTGTTDNSDPLPNSCYVRMKPADTTVTHFFACWAGTDQRFGDKAGFSSYLREVANRLAHPIDSKLLKKYN